MLIYPIKKDLVKSNCICTIRQGVSRYLAFAYEFAKYLWINND